MGSRRFLFVLCLSTFAPVADVGAKIIRVPSEYPTINTALDVAHAGDSLLVAPGVYDQYETRLIAGEFWFSSVGFLKSGVVVLSESGPEDTILRMDSTNEEPIVLLGYALLGLTEVRGFTFSGTAPGLFGLEFLNGGRLVLRDCVFRDLGTGLPDEGGAGSVKSDLEVYGCRFENINGASGSAIYQTSGTVLVEDSEFVNCRSGAMRLEYDDSFPHATALTMWRCRFLNNVKTSGGGGAVYVINYSAVLVEDSWFEGNQSITNSPSGGAIQSGGGGSIQTIRGCTFVNNSVDFNGYGGAIRAHGQLVTIEGNTFFGNAQELNWSTGGAAVVMEAATNVFERNVVVSSTGDQAVSRRAGTMQTGCNVYWNNPLGNTSGFAPDPTDVEADPLLCGTSASNFSVSASSPCLPGNGHPSCTELIGAWGQGCGAVSVGEWPFSTWAGIKSRYR